MFIRSHISKIGSPSCLSRQEGLLFSSIIQRRSVQGRYSLLEIYSLISLGHSELMDFLLFPGNRLVIFVKGIVGLRQDSMTDRMSAKEMKDVGWPIRQVPAVERD